MKFSLKFVLFITLLLVISPTICLAKSIRINGNLYETDSILETNTYVYNANKNTITLKNANLSSLETENDLKFILQGENKIEGSGTLDGIKAKSIVIEGSGSLEITNVKNGIYGTKITVNNTNLKINANNYCFNSNQDMIINNSKLVLKSQSKVFNVISNDLYFNNSKIEVVKTKNFVGNFLKNLYINNTTLNILENETLKYNQIPIYVNGLSKIMIKSTNNKFKNSNYVLGENLKMLGSSDGLNYQETINSSDSYIKIYNILDDSYIESLKEKIKELEDELTKKTNELKKIDEDIIKKEKELDSIVDEFVKKENELNALKDSLVTKQENINNLELDLENKKNVLVELDNKILVKTKELDDLKLNLNSLENLLKTRKLEFEKLEKEYLRVEENLEKVNSELILKKEELDNVLDTNKNIKEDVDNIRNPKTFNDLTTWLSLLIVSFIGIVVLFKKKRCIDG